MDVNEMFVVAGVLALSALVLVLFFGAKQGQRAVPDDGVQQARLDVNRGYQPARLLVQAGVPVDLTVVRHDDSPCTEELAFPGLGLLKSLPGGETVHFALPPLAPGRYEFTCGMNMLRGTLEVEA